MPQRASLLIAVASLGMHLPDPWVADFFAVSERPLTDPDCVDRPVDRALTGAQGAPGDASASGDERAEGDGEGEGEGEERAAGGSGGVLDGQQLAHLLWAVSCVVSEPPATWLDAWERGSLPRLRELGPNMLAVVLKVGGGLGGNRRAAKGLGEGGRRGAQGGRGGWVVTAERQRGWGRGGRRGAQGGRGAGGGRWWWSRGFCSYSFVDGACLSCIEGRLVGVNAGKEA